MNAESLLRLSQIAILVGALIAALGTFGAFHFKEAKDREVQERQNERLSKIDKKLDQIIIGKKDVSVAKKHDVLNSVERSEKEYLTELRSKYDLGYALLYAEKENWYFIPRKVDLIVDWLSAKIIALTKDQVTIALPDFSDTNHNRFYGNTVTLSRRPGASVRPFLVGSIEVVVECLSTTEDSVTIVIGFRNIAKT